MYHIPGYFLISIDKQTYCYMFQQSLPAINGNDIIEGNILIL